MTLIPAHIQYEQSLSSDNPDVIGRYCPAQTKDGFVMICVVSDKNLQGLATALERPDLLADPRFSRAARRANVRQLIDEVETWSRQRSARECEEILNKAGVPCGVHARVAELFDHPQVVERESFSTVHNDELGDFLVQNLPAKFRHIDSRVTPWAAQLGEHTDAVLAERLHLDQAEIARLREAGVVS